MKNLLTCCLVLGCLLATAQPIALHPDNPHYFVYQGKPTVLISSAEHYGSVINAAFDYKTYLRSQELAGMNYTRILTGSYVEIPGSFAIEHNNLSPAVGDYISPWKRLAEPGLFQGEGKVDLSAWNPAYFERLRGFVGEAEKRGIIVEVSLFCATYKDDYWTRHPFNPGNNINELGSLKREDFNTLKNERVVFFQQELIRKIATELNDFDNVLYELSNEPWADNPEKSLFLLPTIKPGNKSLDWALWTESATPATLAWQKSLAKILVATEKNLPKQHLIAQNFTNFKISLPDVDPNVSILNFHYAWPEVVSMNYGWNRPVSFDESGFAGSADSAYLEQAWAFMLAGGAVFNNLDYSFVVGKETGTDVNTAPGAGSPEFREQLGILRDFMDSFDFIRMRPAQEILYHTPGLVGQAIAEPGKQYGIFLSGTPDAPIWLKLESGAYKYQFINTDTGKTLAEGGLLADTEITELPLPTGANRRLALRIISVN